jgi:ADP-ribose pyrophosphatase YjhB (NUDIX family)
MHLTIYFNSKPLFLCSKATGEIEDYLHRNDTISIDELNTHTVKTMIHEMARPEIRAGVFLHNDPEELLDAFKARLTLIQAAGGLVYTDDHHILLIFRKGKWDLPKGKLDEGESLEECAVREVQEETGISSLQLEKPLCITYHTYHQDGQHILKESHWYMMKAAQKEELTPQTEEDIEKCEWAPAGSLGPYMSLTHASIADVARKGAEMLGERTDWVMR